VTPGHHNLNYYAGVFSLLIHGLFALALVFGVTWRTQPVGPTVAYLWDALPPLPKIETPPPAPASKPEPAPQPASPPEPAPVAPPTPKPPPVVKEVPKPDISLEKAEEKKRKEAERQEALRQEEERRRLEEEKRRLEEERLRKEEQRKEDQRKEDERRKEEQRKEEQRKLEQRRAEEKQRQDELRRQETQRQLEEEQKVLEQQRVKEREMIRQRMEQELARQMAEELNQERAHLEFTAAALARGKMVLDYQDKIRLKIRGLLRLPPSMKGNPEVVYRVNLLPNGEVDGRPILIKSSGVVAYDYAVERAIMSASPLPLPPDKEAAAKFREGLELKFRPED